MPLFVGFRSRVTEKDPVSESGVNQLLRQTQYRFVGVAVAGMPEFPRLFGQRLNQPRVRMAEGVHRYAPRKVDILFSLLIPQA